MGRSRRHPELAFGALAIGSVAYAISQTMLVPSLPDIEKSFSATPSEVTVLMTSFWVSGAVSAGIFGRLADMFGKRLILAIVLALFAAGAFFCAIAPSLLLMIGGRLLMGCGVSVFPISFAVIRDEFPSRKAAGRISILAGALALGAAAGQATGGLVSDTFGFRAVFWISLILGLVALAALLAFVPESILRSGGRVDIVGAILLAVGLGAPLIAVAKAPAWGWASAPTLVLALVGAVTLGAFARVELRRAAPLVDVPLLLSPRIRLTNAATLFAGAGLFAFSTILSQFFQEPESTGYGPGASATQAGLFLVPGLLVLAIVSPIGGRVSNRHGPLVTARIGAATTTAAMFAMVAYHAQTWELYLWPTLMYAGSGFTFGALPTIILQNVPPGQSGESSAINQILRTAGSAIGIQVAATLVTISIGAGGNPTDHGYTAAFALCGCAGVVALAFLLVIPRRTLATVHTHLATEGGRG
jgi:MFS family permease